MLKIHALKKYQLMKKIFLNQKLRLKLNLQTMQNRIIMLKEIKIK